MNFTVEEILEATNAKVLKKNINQTFEFSTDTRSIGPKNIYLPLSGEKFNGEDFIKNAIDAECKAYFTTKNIIFNDAELILQVENTMEAYLNMAKFYKNKISPKVIALTGSSGKTTTKEMLFNVCKQSFKTHGTPLNNNNEVGFCQTILSMPKDTEVLILEMGMRGLGEIELLSRYATPDVTIITNVGTSHIGRLGSKENIAKAKCEITAFQKQNGLFVAHDNDLIKDTVNFAGEKIYFSLSEVEFLEKTVGKTLFLYKNNEYQLNIEGDYNVENALSVINTGLYLKMTPKNINQGLIEYEPISKRWEIQEVNGYKVINDSYNANPESMKAALSVVFELYTDAVLVLGNMGELGVDEILYHKGIADFILEKKQNINNLKVLTVGNLAKEISIKLKENDIFTIALDDNEQAACYILDNIKKGNTIFLKASRSMKFEEIVDGLKGDKK